MPENLMIQSHKFSTPAFREGWDRTFKKPIFKDCAFYTRDERRKKIFGLDPIKVINYQMHEHAQEMQKETERIIFTGKWPNQ